MCIMSTMRIAIEEANPLPIYKQIKEQIKTYIIENGIEEGTLLPDINTIASTAGVSLKTAERALNELIREGICFRRPKKGTFVGKSSAAKQKRICGIYHAKGLRSFERDVIQSAIYRGITSQAEKEMMDIFFITPDAKESISFYLTHKELDFRGIIMLHWEGLKELEDLAKTFTDIKFVHLNYHLNGFDDTPSNIYGVFNDEYAGAYQMTEYLIGKGHKKIAVFSKELPNENYRQRIEGYRHSLEDNGIRFRKSLVYTIERREETDLRDIGKKLASDLTDSGRRPTAILCVNDVMASGVIEYLREIGRDKEIEVAGYDNAIPHISRDHNFSTVKVDFEKMGAKAVDILTNKKGNYSKVLKITPQVLIRN